MHKIENLYKLKSFFSVVFVMSKTTSTNASLTFLMDLDKKVHYVAEGEYCGAKVFRDAYTEKNLTSHQIARVIEIVEREDTLVFYPINTNFGFSVGFQVGRIENSKGHVKVESLLTFKE